MYNNMYYLSIITTCKKYENLNTIEIYICLHLIEKTLYAGCLLVQFFYENFPLLESHLNSWTNA